MPQLRTAIRILSSGTTLLGLAAGRVAGQTHSSPSLVGMVRDSAGRPIREVEIALDSAVVLARTDSLGRFTVPHLPAGQHTLRFEKPGLRPMRLRAEVPADAGDAALSLGEIVLRVAPERVLRVSVAFTDATSGRAVEGVLVSVGRRVVGYGDKAGRFYAGSVRLHEGDQWSFRRLGFQPVTFDLWPSATQTALDLAIKLTPAAITLGVVEIRGDVSRALTPWMRDFEQRRRDGWGTFLGREEILKHQASPSATSLLSWAGVNISGDVLSVRSVRVFGAHCWPPGPPLIYLDGMRLGEESALDWLDMFTPEQLDGVEVYSSPGDIPPIFNATGSECGVIAVWTKR